MQITVRVDTKQAERMLSDMQRKQIPFATAYALTQSAKKAQGEVEKAIGRVFDRPTPFTRQAVRIRPATKARLQSEVKLKDEAVKGNPAVRWLIAQITGGSRATKGFERLLQRAGVMPYGWYAVPTKYAPYDQYGNVPASVITKLLSQLQASRDPGTRETAKAKRSRNSMRSRVKRRLSRYFVVFPGSGQNSHLTPGIWERVAFGFGSSIRPVFVYTSNAPTYKRRLMFDRIVLDTANRQLPIQFDEGMRIAMSTAR
jgi:hypothetical protein